MKRIYCVVIAIICLTVILSISAFAYDENKDYVVARSTAIYPGQAETGALLSVSKEKRLTGFSSNSGWTGVVDSGYVNVSRGAYSGYTKAQKIVPLNKSYYLNTGHAGIRLDTYANITVVSGTYAAYYSGVGTTRIYRVMNSDSDNFRMSIPVSKMTRTYGS